MCIRDRDVYKRQYQWRSDGEAHLWSPQSIHKLQKAARTNDFATFKEYSKLINEQSEHLCTLRGLFEFKPAETPVPLEEVLSLIHIYSVKDSTSWSISSRLST